MFIFLSISNFYRVTMYTIACRA